MTVLFTGGPLFCTPRINAWLWENPSLPQQLMDRHVQGDWSEMELHDQQANWRALVNGGRIFSRYTVLGKPVWVITEAKDDEGNRSHTTILFPEEY